MSRTVTSAQRRMLADRARRRGMTVEQYLDWADKEHEEMSQRYALMTNRQLQHAVITQHAARNGRTFTRWEADRW